jgi:protein-tyrosine phosphatase
MVRASRLKSASPPAVTGRVLMVCLGNICRSPTAEVVLRTRLAEAGLGGLIEVDSAGTGARGHQGAPPDPRSQRHAAQRGYDLSQLRARQVLAQDFERFDWILAMDEDNLRDLQDLCPDPHAHKMARLMDFAPGVSWRDVPDPYYGGSSLFEAVLDLIEQGCKGWVESVALRRSASQV